MSLLGLAMGIGLGLLCWQVGRSLLDAPSLRRTNRDGKELPTASGLLVLVGLVAAAAVVVVLDVLGVDVSGEGGSWFAYAPVGGWAGAGPVSTLHAWLLVVFAAVGFGLFGFIDDVSAPASGGGFRGHLSALAEGRVTSGLLKLLGGLAVATVTAGWAGASDLGGLMRDALLIAAAANLANLFDLAPGRTVKVATVAWVLLLVGAGIGARPAAASLVLGVALGLLPAELAQRHMLGDTGANLLGAALGAAAVTSLGATSRSIVVAVLVALNLASEVVSFSRVIDRVPPLRWLDRLGTDRS